MPERLPNLSGSTIERVEPKHGKKHFEVTDAEGNTNWYSDEQMVRAIGGTAGEGANAQSAPDQEDASNASPAGAGEREDKKLKKLLEQGFTPEQANLIQEIRLTYQEDADSELADRVSRGAPQSEARRIAEKNYHRRMESLLKAVMASGATNEDELRAYYESQGKEPGHDEKRGKDKNGNGEKKKKANGETESSTEKAEPKGSAEKRKARELIRSISQEDWYSLKDEFQKQYASTIEAAGANKVGKLSELERSWQELTSRMLATRILGDYLDKEKRSDIEDAQKEEILSILQLSRGLFEMLVDGAYAKQTEAKEKTEAETDKKKPGDKDKKDQAEDTTDDDKKAVEKLKKHFDEARKAEDEEAAAERRREIAEGWAQAHQREGQTQYPKRAGYGYWSQLETTGETTQITEEEARQLTARRTEGTWNTARRWLRYPGRSFSAWRRSRGAGTPGSTEGQAGTTRTTVVEEEEVREGRLWPWLVVGGLAVASTVGAFFLGKYTGQHAEIAEKFASGSRDIKEFLTNQGLHQMETNVAAGHENVRIFLPGALHKAIVNGHQALLDNHDNLIVSLPGGVLEHQGRLVPGAVKQLHEHGYDVVPYRFESKTGEAHLATMVIKTG